jgi:hypothetical protein
LRVAELPAANWYTTRFPTFDDLVTLAVRAADGDERHGPFLPKGGYEDEAQYDSYLSSSPLLKHYPSALVVLGRNNPSLYTVKGRPLYVHLNGLAIVLLK